ncbi:MAG: glycosyltransferase family 2 protein [Candidatus Hodarchaeota archaeon]
MKDKIKISAIIPTYNRVKTIERCLDSVLNQTYKPYEIVIVDDSSKDDTANRVKKYKDSRIKYLVLEKRSGAQVARNRGIVEAKGDWIAFLDSDDEWIKSKLERQSEKLKEYNFNPFIVIYSDGYWINQRNNILDNKVPKISFNDSYKDLLKAPGPMFQGILVSKIALREIGLLDENVPSFHEWDTSLMLSNYCRFVYMDEKLFKYHLHEGETISKKRKKDIQGYGYIINKFEVEMRKYGFWEKHIIKQIYRSLEFKLWKESGNYLQKLMIRDVKSLFLKLFFNFCRIFHVKPSKIRKLMGIRYTKGIMQFLRISL